MTLRVASRSMRPPKLLPPSPIAETRRPDWPRLRNSIGCCSHRGLLRRPDSLARADGGVKKARKRAPDLVPLSVDCCVIIVRLRFVAGTLRHAGANQEFFVPFRAGYRTFGNANDVPATQRIPPGADGVTQRAVDRRIAHHAFAP